jgi:hypothetical protein
MMAQDDLEQIPEAEQSGNLPAIQEDTEYGPDETVRPDPVSTYSEALHQAQARTHVTGQIDVASLVKAQAEYIDKMTLFLQTIGRAEDFQERFNLTQRYSVAQADYIAAMQETLRQLGVI